MYDTGSVSRLGGGVRTGDGEEEGVISQTCSWSPPPAPTQAANEGSGSFHNHEHMNKAPTRHELGSLTR